MVSVDSQMIRITLLPPEKVRRINNSLYIQISWRGQTFWLDSVVAASQNAAIRVLAASNLHVDLLVRCGNHIPAKMQFVRSYSGRNVFRTVRNILANLLLQDRKKEKLDFVLFAPVRTWFILQLNFFFMFLVSKLQGNFQAKEHGLIILQNHDPEMCGYIFPSHLKGLFN